MLPPTLTGVTSRVMNQWASDIFDDLHWEGVIWGTYFTTVVHGHTQSVVGSFY